MENNAKNRQAVAEVFAERMDQIALVKFVIEAVKEGMEKDDDCFNWYISICCAED